MSRPGKSWRLGWLLPIILAAGCDGGGNPSTPASTPLDVTSGPAGSPVISAFGTPTPATNAGRTAQLTWTVTGADRLLIQPGAINVTGQTQVLVPVTAGATYALEASNTAGTSRATTAIRVYDWSAVGTTLDAADTGYAFQLFDRTGLLYERAGGDISQNQLVPLASATKLPSVAAILTLVDTGQLALDVPVSRYLAFDPDFEWPSDKSAITMRMLLAHTAGIVGLADNQPNCLDNERGVSLRFCAQVIANTDLVAAPGITFNYGGADFQIAAYIATLITGQNWQDFFQTRIGTPLGLTRFTYGDADVVINPRVAGGASSNTTDYARILGMVLNGGTYNGTRVLSEAMIGEITANQINGLPVAFAPFPAERVDSYPGYGLGVFISAPSLHPGSNGPEYSDPGLFGATPWIDSDLGYGGVLLIQSTTIAGLDLWNALRPTIIRQITGN